MSFTTELLSGEPIIFQVANSDYDHAAEAEAAEQAAVDLLDQVKHPVFFVFDSRKMHFDFDVVQESTYRFSRENRILRHPKLREYLIVSEIEGADLISNSLDTKVYGHVKMRAFKTPEDALSYARKAAQS